MRTTINIKFSVEMDDVPGLFHRGLDFAVLIIDSLNRVAHYKPELILATVTEVGEEDVTRELGRRLERKSLPTDDALEEAVSRVEEKHCCGGLI